MTKYKIAVIPGDGIGPEVTASACEVLQAVGRKSGHAFSFTEVMAGGIAIDTCGEPLPKDTLRTARESDAVLLGAVGGPNWDNLPGDARPEAALLGLRKGLGLFANLRLAVLFPELKEASPLRPDLVKDGVDILIVRELTGGIYFGKRGREKKREKLDDGTPKGVEAFDVECYCEAEIERILRVGFNSAMQRRKRLTVVDKANILETSRLWRQVTEKVKTEYPEVDVDFMYVDNASMQLLRRPKDFDVIVTSNMFGDILSDEAGMITGSIGMLPSASLGTPGTPGMYEPVHGSAPDIAGQGIANPLATILSAAMMLRYSLGLPREGAKIEEAVENVLAKGFRTADIVEKKGDAFLGTKEITEKVISEYEKL
ncbi:MAG: 3-isopropylmalate dehydrogenase [Clostridiales bacterium]|nr:3-isopropylmalate dehydrogenase [Clostridiales bacterium]